MIVIRLNKKWNVEKKGAKQLGSIVAFYTIEQDQNRAIARLETFILIPRIPQIAGLPLVKLKAQVNPLKENPIVNLVKFKLLCRRVDESTSGQIYSELIATESEFVTDNSQLVKLSGSVLPGNKEFLSFLHWLLVEPLEWNNIRISGDLSSPLTRYRLSLCRRLLPNGIIVRYAPRSSKKTDSSFPKRSSLVLLT